MKEAIIKIGSQQVLVTEGQKISVRKVTAVAGETMMLDDVLAIIDGSSVTIGKPTVSGAKVEAMIDSQDKGKKIDVYRYRAKSRYRKHTGKRMPETTLTIKSINTK